MTDILALTNTFEPTKANIETLSQLLAEQILDGADPIRLSIQLAALEQTCKAAKDKIQEATIDELSKHNGKCSIMGATVERTESGVTYDYSESEAWTVTKEKEDFWANRRKEIETMAKACQDNTTILFADSTTGETWEVKKPFKKSKTVAKITLGK